MLFKAPFEKKIPTQLHLILVIWGKEYCDNFLYKNLMTRLTKNGLCALNQSIKVIYKIYAPQNDLIYIKNSKPYEKLSQTVTVELIDIDINTNEDVYKVFGRIHNIAIEEAYQSNAGMMFDGPDAIYGASFFANLAKLILAGYRLILAPGVNLSLEDVYHSIIFNEKILNQDDYKDEDLISLALEYSHPERVLKRFHHQQLPLFTPTLFWKAQGKNFFQQAFHTHPMYIYPEKKIKLLCQTIDYGEYLFNACPSKKYHFFANGAELVFFELSRKNKYFEEVEQKATIRSFLLWAHSNTHKYQSAYFYKKKHYYLNNAKTPFAVFTCWFIFTFSLKILQKLPLFLLKPFLFSCFKRVSRNPDLKFWRYLRKEILWNFYETKLRLAAKEYQIEDFWEFIENNKNNIRTKLFLRFDFFSMLEPKKKLFFVKKLKILFPSKKFHKKLDKYLKNRELYFSHKASISVHDNKNKSTETNCFLKVIP